MLLVPDVGEKVLLDYLRSSFQSMPLILRLFQNDHVPTPADDITAYVEANFDGYSQIVLGGPWSVASMLDGRAFIAQVVQVWTSSGAVTPNDIWGYYIVTSDGTRLVLAERFPVAPVLVSAAGDQVVVTPSLTLRSEP